MTKGQLSIEFVFSILLLLLIVYIFITTNIGFKNKLESSINYKDYNTKSCILKEQLLIENNGVIKNDECNYKKTKSTSNDT